jgi:hypothetical protein
MANLYVISPFPVSTLSELHLFKNKMVPLRQGGIETVVCNPLRERGVTGYGIFHTMSKKGNFLWIGGTRSLLLHRTPGKKQRISISNPREAIWSRQ